MLNVKCIDFDIQHLIFKIQYCLLVLRHSYGVTAQLKIVVVDILSGTYR